MKNKFNWQLINDSIIDSDKKALTDFINTPNQRFTNGPKVREFEQKWAEWLGVKHSLMINSGAMGNYMSISLMKEITKKNRGEVIVPALSWVSDISSIVNLGFKPVFVDVDFTNLAMTLESIKEAYNENTVGIVLVHLLGFNALTDEILKFVNDKDLFLIEDVCESHGVSHNGNKVGVFGDVSVFSFYFGHHMTTIEGGMICTNDDDTYELCRMFRSHGFVRETSSETIDKFKKKYPDVNPLFTFGVAGYNTRSTELNAVLGLEQIQRLDYNIECRKLNLKWWLDNLSDNFFTDYNRDGNSNFALPLILKEKDLELFEACCKLLTYENVEYRVGTAGGGNQARQPYLERCDFVKYDLKNVDHIHDFGLYIGNHPELTKEQIVNLCKELNSL